MEMIRNYDGINKLTPGSVENVVAWYRKYGWKSTQRRYKSLRMNHCKLRRMEKFIEERGNRVSKLNELKEGLYAKFMESRSRMASVHDWDLQAWSQDIIKRMDFSGFAFKCSRKFLQRFKKQYRISSRKITKFCTKRILDDQEVLQENAREFVASINEYVETKAFLPEEIWNTDQSGFTYELVGNRTLSFTGEKQTLGLCQTQKSLTHSYTVQVLISPSGKLGNKIYICFQEPGGVFGPRVLLALLDLPFNVEVDCTTSGKMTKRTVERWAESCLAPEAAFKILLLQDSWSGQKELKLYEDAMPGCEVTVRTIPPKTTDMIQPLDVYFFRQLKILVRRLSDVVRTSAEPVRLHDRQFIIKMISFCYNQLCAPIFEDMIIYAWQKPGYAVPRKINSFQSVINISFRTSQDCEFPGCENIPIIVCAFCQLNLCFTHILSNGVHLHEI